MGAGNLEEADSSLTISRNVGLARYVEDRSSTCDFVIFRQAVGAAPYSCRNLDDN